MPIALYLTPEEKGLQRKEVRLFMYLGTVFVHRTSRSKYSLTSAVLSGYTPLRRPKTVSKQ